MKNKGFTLVEILAVVMIIGILALICIPAINSMIDKSKEKTLEEQKSAILLNLKNWAAANVMTLPTTEGATVEVTINELKKKGFIDEDLRNPLNNKCFDNSTILVVTRNHNNYEYSFKDGENINYTDTCSIN